MESSPMTNDELGILSAVWVLACNDENPLMTYKSVRHRLGLSDDYPLEQLIKSRRELFRQGAPDLRVQDLKTELSKGSAAGWLEGLSKEERDRAIQELTKEGVFRSQFRVVRGADKSRMELIEWGLQHLERLRKNEQLEEESRWKVLKEAIIPIVSILVAALAVGSTSWFQYLQIESQLETKKHEIDSQERLKKYEVSFSHRITGYANLLEAYRAATEHARSGNGVELKSELERMDESIAQLRPFLHRDFYPALNRIFSDFKTFSESISLKASESLSETETRKLGEYNTIFTDRVFEETFEKSPYVESLVLYPTR